MANIGNVQSYLLGSFSHTSANREDLVDWIANVDPYETPLTVILGRTQARSVVHQWQTDSLRARNTRGIGEGLDWSPVTETAPARVTNHTEIFGQNLAVSETQRAENPAGFKDTYAYYVEKATKATMVDIEVALMEDSTSATGTSESGSGRVMKTLEDFITTNVNVSTDYVNGTSATVTASAGVIDKGDVDQLLNDIWDNGGNTDLIVVPGATKRQISLFSSTDLQRNILAEQKKIVEVIDVYDSDFGLIAIQLNRWCPVGTNTASATANASSVAGRVWFLQRSLVRLAWLRPLQHQLMGKRGDSVVGQIRAELTLEVGNEAGLGVMKGVNNKFS
jgi:hypothetical protein